MKLCSICGGIVGMCGCNQALAEAERVQTLREKIEAARNSLMVIGLSPAPKEKSIFSVTRIGNELNRLHKRLDRLQYMLDGY